MKNNYTIVSYNDQEYVVATTSTSEPFVFDKHKLDTLPNVKYFLSSVGYICCRIEYNISLHHLIKHYTGVSVDHINQIKTDNREANLRYASQNVQNKNQGKRKRNVVLPEDCSVKAGDIPTFIWYIKENGSHGDRWMVEIKEKYSWKTTSTKELSTKCKFELAKKHLRNLIVSSPKLFEGHCMNGELSDNGKILEKEYIEILQRAGFIYQKKPYKDYLIEDLTGLTDTEVKLIQDEKDYVHNNLPENVDFDLPKYCYYVPANDAKGDGFTCGRLHPKHSKDWTTTRKRAISTEEKFKQLLAYVNDTAYTLPIVEKEKQVSKAVPINVEKKMKLLSNEQLMEIITKKQEQQTTEDISKWIKETYDLTIPRFVISQIWNGETELPEDITKTEEYKSMMSNTKKRTVKATKFTKEEIEWVKENKADRSLGECAKQFEAKFNKTITKTYVSKIK